MPKVTRRGTETASGAPHALSASDRAMIELIASAREQVLANLSGKESPEVAKAMIAAAQRGVRVTALLATTAGHDKTWIRQQRLEACGIDVDVHKGNELGAVLLVVDGTTLSLDASGAPKQDANRTAVTELADRFVRKMKPSVTTDVAGGLIAREKLALHAMPESSAARIVALIDAAKTTIDLEIYQLQDRAVTKALVSAAARGVKVRVMLEPRTVGSKNFVQKAAELTSAGVDVKETPPEFNRAHNVDHAKFMVIDGKEVLFGTGNLARSGLGGVTEEVYANRDFWVEDGRAKTVSEAATLFEHDWKRQTTTSVRFENLVLTPDNANARILELIAGAQRRLFVYNQELADPDLVGHLLEAKRRGVDVEVLLGYQPGFGRPAPNRSALEQLKAAGVKASYLKSHYLHAKAIVADDKAYLGSQNFTNGGLRNNRELGEIFDDPTLVKQLVDVFEKDLGDSAALDHPAVP